MPALFERVPRRITLVPERISQFFQLPVLVTQVESLRLLARQNKIVRLRPIASERA